MRPRALGNGSNGSIATRTVTKMTGRDVLVQVRT
jgi:hypothetical protein